MEKHKNQILFLEELRSGKYKKGCTKSDKNGYPIFEKEEDKDGCCVCGLMVMLFPLKGKANFTYAKRQLGVTNAQCNYIQKYLNDSHFSFATCADIIEKEIFKSVDRESEQK